MAKAINEAGFSLLPNLGITGQTVKPGGTIGTTSSIGLNTPGSKTQQMVKTTAATTKQINDLVAKIATQKQKAAQANTPEQQALLQSVNLLQKQLQQLVASEQEENIKNNPYKKISNNMQKKPAKVRESITGVLKKGAGAAGGGFLGKAAGTALAGPIGGVIGSVVGSGLGAEAMDDDEESCKMKTKKNKNKKSKKVQEAILPAVGKAVSGAVKTAGNIAGMVPVAGAPVKAAADLAGDVTTGVLGGGENEENLDKLTPIQDEVVDALIRNKYYINRVSYQHAEEEGGPTVYMSKKPNRYSTRYAEVAPDGFVNGESIEDFLKGHEENEEKMLSKKQQRIAKLAGDPNKIDGADFAKLRAMKESVQIPTFLKAILQKNYAQADKYLGSIINGKIKNLINTALDKNL